MIKKEAGIILAVALFLLPLVSADMAIATIDLILIYIWFLSLIIIVVEIITLILHFVKRRMKKEKENKRLIIIHLLVILGLFVILIILPIMSRLNSPNYKYYDRSPDSSPCLRVQLSFEPSTVICNSTSFTTSGIVKRGNDSEGNKKVKIWVVNSTTTMNTITIDSLNALERKTFSVSGINSSPGEQLTVKMAAIGLDSRNPDRACDINPDNEIKVTC